MRCFLLLTAFVFLETFLDFLLSHQRKDPELFAAGGDLRGYVAAGLFLSILSLRGSFACPSSSPDNKSYLQSRGVSPGSSSRVPSLHASSHQAPSKCFVAMRLKRWGRKSGKVFRGNGGPLGTVSVFPGGCSCSAAGPVTRKAVPCGHSHPRNVRLPPPQLRELG